MLKLRILIEKVNGHGLTINDWDKLEDYLRNELSVYLDHSVVKNTGEDDDLSTVGSTSNGIYSV